jgi:transcriptional regulator with XRE-family HTH domain
MMDELLAERLGARLYRVRLERGLSLRQAAAQTGVTKETISDLERALRHPHPPTLAKIAAGYGVEISDLLGPLEEPAPKAAAPSTSGQPRGDRRWSFEPPESVERRLSLFAQAIVDAADGWARMAQEPGVDDGRVISIARMVSEQFDAIYEPLGAEGAWEELPNPERVEVIAVGEKLNAVLDDLLALIRDTQEAAKQEARARENRKLIRERTRQIAS